MTLTPAQIMRVLAATVVVVLVGCGTSDQPDEGSKRPATPSTAAARPSTTTEVRTTVTTAPAKTPADGAARVSIKDFSFTPRKLRVRAGTRVTFSNDDDTQHTATSDRTGPTPFDSGRLSPGKTFSYTFAKPGAYAYVCDIHNYMRATVEVS